VPAICQEDKMNATAKYITMAAPLSNSDFTRLSRFIYDECGIRLVPAKKSMLEARLQKRLRQLGMHSFQEYCDYLFSQKGNELELVQMIDLVTTNKTDFFREPDHFDYLLGRVLPEWSGMRPQCGARKFNVWSAGCSSGEEPYTLAMVLAEYAEEHPGFNFQVLATDISTRVLEKARMAVYTEDRVLPVPPGMRKKHLMRSRERGTGLVRVVPELREKVRFRRLNFMDAEYGIREKLDVIFCRNVIIYFDRQTQEKLLNRFYHHLVPGGHIFMGHSETLSGLDVPLVNVAPTVYAKRR